MSSPIQLLYSEHITWEQLGLLSFLIAHPGQGFSTDELLSLSHDRERLKKTLRRLVKEKRIKFDFASAQFSAMEAAQ